ncbi:MAG TPA: hypothetical protein VGM67_00280 [Gemmatimonadaceae bacterium]|jgi:hypothetical protein
MGFLDFFRSFTTAARAAEATRFRALHLRVSAMRQEDVVREVEMLIERDEFLHARLASRTTTSTDLRLPATVAQVFAKYDSVWAGGAQVDRTLIQVFLRDRRFIQVGIDMEHAAVIVSVSDEQVFVVEDDGQLQPDFGDSYPTLWHYLFEVAAQTRGIFDAPAE